MTVTGNVSKIPNKEIGRLSLYRRLLKNLAKSGMRSVFSHQLASMAGVSAAQLRRDIMNIGYSGQPNRGYAVAGLIESIDQFLDPVEMQHVALVGVGNLGKAILGYFIGRHAKLNIVAAFDRDPQRFGRVIQGCRCYSIADLNDVVEREHITVGIITVPESEAQNVADQLVAAGVKGILNFAPVPIITPPGVYVEDIDMTMTLERAAYYARQSSPVHP